MRKKEKKNTNLHKFVKCAFIAAVICSSLTLPMFGIRRILSFLIFFYNLKNIKFMIYFLIYSYSLYHQLSEYIFIFKIFIVYHLLIEFEIIIF